jgi:hypothetical protein
VLQIEVLVRKLVAVDRLATGAVVVRKVTALVVKRMESKIEDDT